MDIATEGDMVGKTCIVVDENDNYLRIGSLEECHTNPATLHRAFSLLIFDSEHKLLLQQRAKTKYTFPLSWTNTVCSHPRNLKHKIETWVGMRLRDELGADIPHIEGRLLFHGKLKYSAVSDQTYGENEIDHVFSLTCTDEEKKLFVPNESEVENMKWVSREQLDSMMKDERVLVTPWFRAMYEKTPLVGVMFDNSHSDGTPFYDVGDTSIPHSTTDDNILFAPLSYLCSNSGKAVRMLLCEAYLSADKTISRQDIDTVAWIIEGIHASSLLHDDIEDRSDSRRGAPAAHKIFGVSHTLNTGTLNMLYILQQIESRFSHHDQQVRTALYKATLDTLIKLHRGQGLDIYWGDHSYCPTIEEYLDMIGGKTVALIESCAGISSIVGDTDKGAEYQQLYRDIGEYFQIRDDLCNIADPKYWETKGFFEDGDEGKYGYPVIQHFARGCDGDDEVWLKKCLLNDGSMNIDEKLRAYELMYKSGALTKVFHECKQRYDHICERIKDSNSILEGVMVKLYVPQILHPDRVREIVQT